jgi:hypothetical protein
MTLHYHGTPITKRDPHLEKLKGHCFCVSYAHPTDLQWCIENAQSIMLDNGAFTTFTKGKVFDKHGYLEWLDYPLRGPNWAVVPDIIGGSVEEQRECQKDWPYPDSLSCYVWHMNLPLDWLRELVESHPRVAFGSSAEFWQVGSENWCRRADEAFETVERYGNRTWVHMLRGLKVCGKRWPFASADSSNIARNHGSHKIKKCTKSMATRLDSVQCPLKAGRERDYDI